MHRARLEVATSSASMSVLFLSFFSVRRRAPSLMNGSRAVLRAASRKPSEASARVQGSDRHVPGVPRRRSARREHAPINGCAQLPQSPQSRRHTRRHTRRHRRTVMSRKLPHCLLTATAARGAHLGAGEPVRTLSPPSGHRRQDSPHPAVADSPQSRPRVRACPRTRAWARACPLRRAWPVSTCCADWQHVRAGEHAPSPRTAPVDSTARGTTPSTSDHTRDAARRRHTTH